MALIQSQLDNAINNIIARFTGQYISFPDGRYHGECTAPIVWFFSELGIPVPPMFGNRADGWGRSFPNDLLPYFQHEEFQPGKHYPRGTILMWNSPHIALVTGSDGSNTVQVFEQNADPDGAPCKVVLRIVNNQFHACTYAMVPIVTAPAPAGPPYTITQVDPYKRDVLAGHQKWDLNQPNFDAVNANPILTLNQRTTITVAAELHHHHPTLQQYLYLLEDYNVPQGYNFKDTEDYVPPAPPYVPPAAPVPVKLAPKVELVTEVPYYENSTNAKTAYKPQGTLKPIKDGYFQISTDFGMWNLSSDNMKDLQHWVNPKDNVLPTPKSPPIPTPVPEPQSTIPFMPKLPDADKATFSSFTPNGQPVKFIMEDNYNFRDLNGCSKKIVLRKLYDEVDMVGTFYHEGREWTRVNVVDDNGNLDMNRWFACPTINSVTRTPYITPHDKIYEVDTTPAERLSLKHPTPYDKFIQFGATVDVLYSKLHKTIDGFYRQKHK